MSLGEESRGVIFLPLHRDHLQATRLPGLKKAINLPSLAGQNLPDQSAKQQYRGIFDEMSQG